MQKICVSHLTLLRTYFTLDYQMHCEKIKWEKNTDCAEVGASNRETSVKISTICRRRALKSCRRASENSEEPAERKRERERIAGNVGTTTPTYAKYAYVGKSAGYPHAEKEHRPHVLRGLRAVMLGRSHERQFIRARVRVCLPATGKIRKSRVPDSALSSVHDSASRYRLCKAGRVQWSHEEEDLSYETSHNCTPIGPVEECNLSPGRGVFAKVIKMRATKRGRIGSLQLLITPESANRFELFSASRAPARSFN